MEAHDTTVTRRRHDHVERHVGGAEKKLGMGPVVPFHDGAVGLSCAVNGPSRRTRQGSAVDRFQEST